MNNEFNTKWLHRFEFRLEIATCCEKNIFTFHMWQFLKENIEMKQEDSSPLKLFYYFHRDIVILEFKRTLLHIK